MAYFLDPAATGTSLNVAGAIQVDSVNVIGAAGDLKMNNLDAVDFDITSFGAFVVGEASTTTCSTTCINHGLICSNSYSLSGTSLGCANTGTTSAYCWCV